LREFLRQRLPEYMVPAGYLRLEKLPLTGSGKVDRQGLPAVDAAAFVFHEYAAPLGKMETAVAQVWSELLKVERVGRRDNPRVYPD
jgi:hypothetical protein